MVRVLDTRSTNSRYSAGDYDFDHQANTRLNVHAKEFSINSRNQQQQQQRQAKPRGPQVLNANNIQQSMSLGNMLSTSTSAVNIETLLLYSWKFYCFTSEFNQIYNTPLFSYSSYFKHLSV
jgi:hypothetical protein